MGSTTEPMEGTASPGITGKQKAGKCISTIESAPHSCYDINIYKVF